jgi:hypothetical protein
MLGKYLSGEHLIASPGFGNRTTAFIKLDRSGGGTIVLVLFLVLILTIHRMMLVGYDALAGFPLAGDNGRIGRQDEGRWLFFGPFDLGGQTLSGATLGADTLLVLLPEPAEEYNGPYGDDGGAGGDGGDYGGFGAVAFFELAVGIFGWGWGGRRRQEARRACGASRRVGTWLVEVEGFDSPVKIIL